MINLDKLAERGYEGYSGKVMSEKLTNVNPMFTEGINQWLAFGQEKDYEIMGIRLSDLKKKYALTYPAAILSMDWLIREPIKAQNSFQRGIR